LWAVVGLGNPGKKYEATRHNVGFMLIDRISQKWDVKLRKTKYSARAFRIEKEQGDLLLVKPWTYMNRSGLAVKALIDKTGLKLSHLVTVYDDLDIPLGEIRVRKMGGAGTHNGMISIVQELKSTQFPRIRIGIGPLPFGVEATNFVLSGFVKEEKEALEHSLDVAEEALDLILDLNVEEAMNRFNRTVRNARNKSQDKTETII
jgi:PTH1 family peptidyl-tRNA hydrolase